MGVLILDKLTAYAICDYFDSNMNVTIEQVARKLNVTKAEAQKVLRDQAWGALK